MPLRTKALGTAIESVPVPQWRITADADELARMKAAQDRYDRSQQADPEQDRRDEQYSGFCYGFNSYKSDLSGLIDRFPDLAGDVDIHQALVTIRNAERAIEARAKEILGG